jgi:DNA polymerase III gamma/tau subunit
MTNPLLSKMSNINVNNIMNNNQIMQMVNMMRTGNINQQQLINMISKNNPQMANGLNQLMQSGKTPSEIAQNMVSQHSALEIENAKNIMKQLGMSDEISNKIFGDK